MAVFFLSSLIDILYHVIVEDYQKCIDFLLEKSEGFSTFTINK